MSREEQLTRTLPPRSVAITVIEGCHGVPAADWNALVGTAHPFTRHEFLSALENQACVGGEAGWEPRHLLARDTSGRLVAVMPLYLKHHSWGEFVFDWGWADAYRRAGRAYYPKLVAAIPFTPVTGWRSFAAPDAPPQLRGQLLDAAKALASDSGASSLHVLFPTGSETEVLQAADLLMRQDCQFHWRNRGFSHFDDFLDQFSSAKRKKIRRERRRVTEAGIGFETLSGREITAALWDRIYALYAATHLQRGHMPYLTRGFFGEISQTMGEQIMVTLAQRDGCTIAMALFLQSDVALYGRYWGSDDDYHSLHFETCYYRGIEYCIRQGLERFEPGAQGEHKLARGFSPVVTWSAHWLADPRFHAAIRAYLDVERQHMEAYIESAAARLPFRRDQRHGS